MRFDGLATAATMLPQLPGLLRSMSPTFRVPDVSELDGDFFQRHRLGAAIWDVDGTLMAYHAMNIAHPLQSQIRLLFRDDRVRHAILSNSGEERFAALGDIFPEVPVLRGYYSSSGFVFRRLFQGSDTHSGCEIDELLRSGGRSLRKPSRALVQFAMRELGTADPQEVVVIGDQYLTDVASANLAGTKSVLVDRLGRETFPPHLRLMQLTERILHSVLYGDRSESETDRW